MKFKNVEDVKCFLLDAGRLDQLNEVNETYLPSEEIMELFLKKRTGLLGGLKNFRQSQNAKGSWRKNRADIMRGIKAFHKSTEGKRFHRNLGRFIATRTFTGYLTGKKLGESLSFNEKAEILKAVSSIKTHLFIEMEYYHSVYEQMGLEVLVYDHLDEINDIEGKIIRDELLSNENCGLLISLTESDSIVKAFAESSGKPETEITQIWEKIENDLKSQIDEDSKDFSANVVDGLKQCLDQI